MPKTNQMMRLRLMQRLGLLGPLIALYRAAEGASAAAATRTVALR